MPKAPAAKLKPVVRSVKTLTPDPTNAREHPARNIAAKLEVSGGGSNRKGRTFAALNKEKKQ